MALHAVREKFLRSKVHSWRLTKDVVVVGKLSPPRRLMDSSPLANPYLQKVTKNFAVSIQAAFTIEKSCFKSP